MLYVTLNIAFENESRLLPPPKINYIMVALFPIVPLPSIVPLTSVVMTGTMYSIGMYHRELFSAPKSGVLNSATDLYSAGDIGWHGWNIL